MKLSEILFLDLRNDGAKETLLKALNRIPLFKENTELPSTEELENILIKMQNKYPIVVGYVNIVKNGDEHEPPINYSIMVKETETHKHIKTVWSMTINEGFAKVVLLMYSYIQKHFKNRE